MSESTATAESGMPGFLSDTLEFTRLSIVKKNKKKRKKERELDERGTKSRKGERDSQDLYFNLSQKLYLLMRNTFHDK